MNLQVCMNLYESCLDVFRMKKQLAKKRSGDEPENLIPWPILMYLE